jgi:leucyl aminopeptidase (aminopeptidase T)
MAYNWWMRSIAFKHDMGLDRVQIYYYPNIGSNNNDLPDTLYHWGGNPAELTADVLVAEGMAVPLADVMTETDLIIAPTEVSATAPCKMLAKQYNFRGTTMPGFILEMIPALSLDYGKVHERIMSIKTRLDEAVREKITLTARGKDYIIDCDLRHRTATASSGMFHDDMIVGNLPSGETYIVPYEGEIEGDASRTNGEIPVQFGDEIVVYKVVENRAIEILTEGEESAKQKAMLEAEPAYGNIAELGHGILADFGCTAVGSLLMDEKLGLHIAFGRSEHFGGIVSPKSFNDPKKVVHIDRVYVDSLQPDILAKEVLLFYPDGREEVIMVDGKWTV